MEKIYDLFERYRDYILVFILFVIIALSESFLYYYIRNDLKDIKNSIAIKEENDLKTIEQKKDETKEEVKKTIYVDIKGEVVSPGVYHFEEGKRVIDAVKKAGGLTEKADTSVNNLGKKLTDEMVIFIYSKKQVKKLSIVVSKKSKVVDDCNNKVGKDNGCLKDSDLTEKSDIKSSSNGKSSNKDNKSTSNGKVSLNNASKEELMTLTGIGEAKANSIIEYRNKTKFKSIEDIKNVKGIGDSIFEKIKNNIEL